MDPYALDELQGGGPGKLRLGQTLAEGRQNRVGGLRGRCLPLLEFQAVKLLPGGFQRLGVAVSERMIVLLGQKALLQILIQAKPPILQLPHLLADQTRAVFLAEPVADVIAVTGTVILFTLQFRKALRRLESENKS